MRQHESGVWTVHLCERKSNYTNNLYMNAVTLAEAKEKLEQLIARAITSAEPTIVSTESGQQAVIISLEEFNAWQETLYLLSTPANAEHLRNSIAEARAGKTIEKDLLEP